MIGSDQWSLVLCGLLDIGLSAKIGLVVAVMTIATAIIASVGYLGLHEPSEAANRIKKSGEVGILISRLNTNVTAMNRAEYRMVLDQSDADAAATDFAAEAQLFTERVALVQDGVTGAAVEQASVISTAKSLAKESARLETTVGTFLEHMRAV